MQSTFLNLRADLVSCKAERVTLPQELKILGQLKQVFLSPPPTDKSQGQTLSVLRSLTTIAKATPRSTSLQTSSTPRMIVQVRQQ